MGVGVLILPSHAKSSEQKDHLILPRPAIEAPATLFFENVSDRKTRSRSAHERIYYGVRLTPALSSR